MSLSCGKWRNYDALKWFLRSAASKLEKERPDTNCNQIAKGNPNKYAYATVAFVSVCSQALVPKFDASAFLNNQKYNTFEKSRITN